MLENVAIILCAVSYSKLKRFVVVIFRRCTHIAYRHDWCATCHLFLLLTNGWVEDMDFVFYIVTHGMSILYYYELIPR